MGSDWAVPVLPPMVIPLTCAGEPVPSLTTFSIICLSCLAAPSLIGRPACSGWIVWITLRSLPVTLLTTCGFINTPLFAIAEATISICSGVAATSYCPMLDCAR